MTMWFIARAAGLSAFLAFSIATGLGAASSRLGMNAQVRLIVQYVHRSAAITGLLLLVTHITLLVLDTYAGVGAAAVVVPGLATYRPLAVAAGTLAMYCIVAAATSGLMRGKLVRSAKAARWWRPIHLSAYGAWVLSALHFLTAGTDVGTQWATATFFVGLAFVGAGLTARVGGRQPVVASFRQAAQTAQAAPAAPTNRVVSR